MSTSSIGYVPSFKEMFGWKIKFTLVSKMLLEFYAGYYANAANKEQRSILPFRKK